MKTFGQHQHNFVELITREITERIGALIEREEVILAPFLRPDFGHDLLRQNVERLRRHGDVVQLAAPRRVQQRGASHSSSRDSGKSRPFDTPPTA